MPEEVLKEVAPTGEQPAGESPVRNLASPEFFFLLQRIDRLGEKLADENKALTGEIKAGNAKLSNEIKTLAEEINAVDQRLSNRIDTVEQKLSSRMDTLSNRIDTVEQKLSSRMDGLAAEFKQEMAGFKRDVSGLKLWTAGAVITLIAGFIGTIVTLALR